MSVKITDICICCDSCLDECPTESIVDNGDNPTGEDIYYVNPETCTECIGDNESPACADACPTEGCIVWDVREDQGNPVRDGMTEGSPVVED